MSEDRAVPFYCPFCGEEDLFPAEETPGSWHCRNCTRVFSLRLVGLRPPTVDESRRPSLSVVLDSAASHPDEEVTR